MREIMFRAWDDEEKVMISADDLAFETYLPLWMQFKGSTLTFMQYTGLNDKNGKEIYEGDIVIAYDEMIDTICKGQIVYDECECGFCIKGSEPTFIGYYPELEVIGNIYENIELVN